MTNAKSQKPAANVNTETTAAPAAGTKPETVVESLPMVSNVEFAGIAQEQIRTAVQSLFGDKIEVVLSGDPLGIVVTIAFAGRDVSIGIQTADAFKEFSSLKALAIEKFGEAFIKHMVESKIQAEVTQAVDAPVVTKPVTKHPIRTGSALATIAHAIAATEKAA